MKFFDSSEGFTLIELLVVIAIIGILAAAAIPQVMDAICDSRVASAKSNVATIKTAYVQCKMDDNCDESTFDEANYGDFLPKNVINSFSISETGGSLAVINTADVGCEWNDGSSLSTKLSFNMDDGDFNN